MVDPDDSMPPLDTAFIPRSTYRLQFHGGFRFEDATALVPYLQALGISDLYASSYLKARAGSQHGYDIVDHNALHPETGSELDHERLRATLAAHGDFNSARGTLVNLSSERPLLE